MNKTGTILASRRSGKINETDEKWKCEVAGASPMKSLCPVQRGRQSSKGSRAGGVEGRASLLAPLCTGADASLNRGSRGSSTREPSAAMPSSGSRGQQGACLPGKQSLKMWWWCLGKRWGDRGGRGTGTLESCGEHGTLDQLSLGGVYRWLLLPSPLEAWLTGARLSGPRS